MGITESFHLMGILRGSAPLGWAGVSFERLCSMKGCVPILQMTITQQPLGTASSSRYHWTAMPMGQQGLGYQSLAYQSHWWSFVGVLDPAGVGR